MRCEVTVDSVEGAQTAQAAGAQRIELCSGLELGGLTPSIGLLQRTLGATRLPVYVLIRPRPGDFVYSAQEFDVILEDIQAVKTAGAGGVVVGALTRDGAVDTQRVQQMIQAARPLEVTFHRAFDVCAEPSEALETLIELGVERILTSGGQATAWEGRFQIAQMVRQAGNRVCILVGAGVRPENIGELRQITRAEEFHFSARRRVTSPARISSSAVKMGEQDEPGWRTITDGEMIRKIIAAACAG